MGITSPYPRENIIAGNYILADTQAFLSKSHRQQNNEILIRHSPGIGECFFVMGFSLLSPLEFFVDPKNVDGRNNKPPAMRVRVDCYTKKLPFRVQ